MCVCVCVQEDPDKQSNLPKDGTVHELTSSVSGSHSSTPFQYSIPCSFIFTPRMILSYTHKLQTMWFLEQLLEFSRILGEVSLGQSM